MHAATITYRNIKDNEEEDNHPRSLRSYRSSRNTEEKIKRGIITSAKLTSSGKDPGAITLKQRIKRNEERTRRTNNILDQL